MCAYLDSGLEADRKAGKSVLPLLLRRVTASADMPPLAKLWRTAFLPQSQRIAVKPAGEHVITVGFAARATADGALLSSGLLLKKAEGFQRQIDPGPGSL